MHGWKHYFRGISTFLGQKNVGYFHSSKATYFMFVLYLLCVYCYYKKTVTEFRKQIMFSFQLHWTQFSTVQFLWPFSLLSRALDKENICGLKIEWMTIRWRNIIKLMFNSISKPLLIDLFETIRLYLHKPKIK